MRILINIIRWIVGVLFILSGMVKVIDPIGFSLKLIEYFEVFNLHFLNDYALTFSLIFTIGEVILGAMLILGIKRNFTLISLMLMIIFFTFLTFYSAYFDVVKDCGCFGDAVKLTPWESFSKDIVLLFLILILWLGRKHIDLFLAKPIGSYVLGVVFMITAYVAFMGVYHLPIKDFRPYAVGKNIKEGMKSAEELGLEPPQFELKYNLKNKLNGQQIQLKEDEYINNKSYWQKGTSWELLNTEETIVNEGYQPPIHDFSIECGENGDMTYYYLNLPQLILLVTPSPAEASVDAMTRITKFATEVQDKGVPVLSVASDKVVINNLETCLIDATTLKTMIRSNPGIILLENGTVKAKYHWRDAPSLEEVKNIFK